MSDHKLVIERHFDASVEDVFAAWSSAEALKQWFAPGQMTVPIADVDFSEGGEYKIVMRNKDGEDHSAAGVYKTIDKNKKIVCTWQWEIHEMENPETLLTIDFMEDNGGTKLILTHEKLSSEESAAKHTEGWTGCLVNLEAYLV